jgi:enoyl-CoA hydratase/carnithine racemase
MSTRVSTEIRDEVAHVTMTRADKRNGLDLEMMRALVDAAKQLKGNREIRAVILKGEGESFCAGLDFGSVGKHPVRFALGFLRAPGSATNLYQQVCWAWRELPVPVIAVVHGHCFGGGMQLALAADFRFATPDAQLSIMEAKWGLVPDMTGTVTVRELLGMDVAKRLTMTGEIIDGERAAELGLVTAAGPTPLKEAEALVEQLKTRSPDSVAATKALFHRTRHLSPRAAFRLESRIQRKLLLGANHKIAKAAGIAKEVPKFVRRSFS